MAKTIYTCLLLIGLLPGIANNAIAQQTDDSHAEKYRIKLVQNENGNEKVTDRTFSSRGEMAEFIKANGLDLPEAAEAPPIPPLPPLAPPPPPVGVKQAKDNTCTKKIEHVVIINDKESTGQSEQKTEGDGVLEEDIAAMEEELKDDDAAEIKVIIIKREDNKEGNKQIKTVIINGQPDKRQRRGLKIEEKERPNIGGLKLFPNPANDVFNIEFSVNRPTAIKIRVSDLNGKILYSESLENFSGKFEKKISRSEFPAGTYTVDVESAGEKESKRLVVQ